jgi:signal transduction histidine kinase
MVDEGLSRTRAEPAAARRVSVRTTREAIEHLVGGLGTAVLALAALLWLLLTLLMSVVGVGLVLVPSALAAVRFAGDRERARLARWGADAIDPESAPTRLRDAAADPTTRRELGWVAVHGTLGLMLGAIGVAMPIDAVRDATFPLWWQLLPAGQATPAIGLWTVHTTRGAAAVALLGPAWIVLAVLLGPAMARAQAWPGRRLLFPDPGTDLALRVARLTATRAGALDAHVTELKRIERSLHDGAQNPMVAVTVLLGAARRELARDPAEVDAILERAQGAAEHALAELRAVVRSILPPVLTDRSLADALTGLATTCPVPCRIDAQASERCAASVEATAYFVVAEALTNIARHSNAQQAQVTLRRRGDRLLVTVHDDGRGGADEASGSGLVGIRRRTEAHDGTFTLISPPGGPTTVEVNLPCGS